MSLITCLISKLECHMPHFMKAGQLCWRFPQTTKELMKSIDLE